MANPSDRRSAKRVPRGAATTCSFVARVAEDVGPGLVRDVSAGGVGIITVREVEVGAVLAVGLSNPTTRFARTVRVRVTHISPIPGGFLVGGVFETPLTEQELADLLA